MESYEELRDMWRGLLGQGAAGCCFDLDRLAPKKFCVLFEESFEEAIEEEADEDEKPCTELKALLDAGAFDETEGSHLPLVRLFLTTQLGV